ncbi:3-keto-disaccharide hydrolase [Flavobacterium sp. LB1P62]|uniref:3-keto-disaccharide hydrolase n=1 Tax=Flavobacterium sp. LB1P62 TaxID=3401715 RepID=UPI003AB0F396
MIQIANAQNEFKPLFDGKTTKGWHTYGKTTVGTAWKIDGGILYLDPTAKDKDQGGDLVTDKEYANFHLKLDWKVAPKSNSGIIFYISENPEKYKNTYETGLEMQVLDNDGHPDGKIIKHRAGNLYDLMKSDVEPVKAVGDWNTVEIISKKGELTLILNGITVVKTTLWDENWKTLVSGSKFKAWKDFGTFKKGKIALQDHGDAVWYRNIVIKEL